jgi:H+-transporting ATPase
MGISFGHFFYAYSIYPYDTSLPAEKLHHNYNYQFIQTIMYLQISSCPHFVIFSTRLGSWWWKSMPSWLFTTAILGTQVIAGVITLTGPQFLEAVPIGWGWTMGVLAVSLVMFMLLDVVKVYTFKFWSFELTASLWPVPSRREKLKQRKAKAILDARVNSNIAKLKRAVVLNSAARAFATYGEAKKPVILVVSNSADTIN